MLVNFYADWCRFSQMLKPIFDKAAAQVHEKWPVSAVHAMAVVQYNEWCSILGHCSTGKGEL